MKRLSFVLAIIAVLTSCLPVFGNDVERREEGNLVIETIPDIPPRIIERMVQYINTRGASMQGWDVAGKGIFVSTRFGETNQVHYVGMPGGTRRQLTFFNEPVGGLAVCPAPGRNAFLFTKDVGGGEQYQIFYFDVKTGDYGMLSDGESRNGGQVWSKAGDRFVYYSNLRNGRDWDLYLTPIDSPEDTKPILAEGGVWFPLEWSPDDTKLLVGRYVSVSESYGYVLYLGTGELEEINPSKEKIAYGGSIWSKDGTGIYYSSDEESEFKRLRYYDIESKKSKVITKNIDWDVGEFVLDERGDRLAFTTNEDGFTKLYILDTATMEYEEVPGFPAGIAGGMEFNPNGRRLALTMMTPRTTSDVYVLDLDGYLFERWTYSEIGGLDSDAFAVPRLIHYETFDTVGGKPRMIPAIYYRPVKGEPPYPVLIDMHGGPEGQALPSFSSLTQYAVNELGVAMLEPNVRGSTGYGKTYTTLDNGYKREDSVKDIGALLDWIEKQPELDTSKVGLIGGSYGGYMVYAVMEHFNDRLKCGIDIVGIGNFVTFLENTKEYRRDLRRVEYGDERDPKMREFLTRISPTTNAYKITKPMYIIQGLNDPRVPASEAEQMLDAIRENGGTAWYLLAKDEGHGFRKKKNRDYMYYSAILFLEEHLLE
ncbi:MAG TPA: prolyl oligopeptidase family serine peptidase [Patescibacteria group bacterium]|nr:prolyl oligopeptidase family serine peptidase [Patescibacteria group bacterium]